MNHIPISVVTATPPGFNPGMLACQLVARWFLSRHHLGAGTTFFRLLSMTDRLAHLAPTDRAAKLEQLNDGIDYAFLNDADQLSGTTPLFWGDLLHMRQYLNSIRRRMRPSQSTPEELLLLRSSREDVVRRAVSFGSTFLYHTASDLTAEDYGPCFSRFVGQARLIMPRDMVSLSQLAAVTPRRSPVLGLDVTQLLCGASDWRDIFPEGPTAFRAEPDTLLCHFARGQHDIADLRYAVKRFSAEFGKPVSWLPWGDDLSFPHLKRYEGQLGIPTVAIGDPPKLSAILETLAAAKCVLTDTYHVAVLAWSLGTPALLVRGDYWPGDFNKHVDKRYVFYAQHGIHECFLPTSRDREAVSAFLHKSVALISDGRVLDWHTSSVRQRAEECELQLVSALIGGLHGG
jgi:hypothetical protein